MPRNGTKQRGVKLVPKARDKLIEIGRAGVNLSPERVAQGFRDTAVLTIFEGTHPAACLCFHHRGRHMHLFAGLDDEDEAADALEAAQTDPDALVEKLLTEVFDDLDTVSQAMIEVPAGWA